MQSDDIGSHQEKCSIRDLQSLRAKGDHIPESAGSHSGSDNIETVSDHSDVDQTSTKRAKIVFDNNRKTSQTDIDRRLRLDVGVCSKKGHRKIMEDQHVANQAQVPTDAHFFAIYDGHGGVKCAEYLRDNLHTIVCKNIYLNDDPERALRESIAEVEHLFTDYSKEVKDSSGSTVAVSILAGSRLVCGNVGDSEIVLCRAGAPIVLTIRHVPNNRDEEARVIAAGGRMYRQRVGHPKFNPQFVSLAISRTIGDVGFKLQEYTDGKSSGIIADADTTSTELGATDQFLILACDGLWNVFSYQEAVNFCLFTLETGKKAQATVEDLVDEALRRGSTDNVTCLLVCFDHTPQPSNGLVAHSELSLISKEVFIADTINPMCDD